MFNPETEYDITLDTIHLRDFRDYWEDYVVRPPYQRKSVWSRKKQQALLDSLMRRYYIPRLVIREVRLGSRRTVKEVIDGQQRITTAKSFFDDQLQLPRSLKSLDPELPGLRYSELPVDLRKFVDKELKFNVDLVKGIDDPKNREHQRIASEIFWRLQQGESLTYMEVAHARLSSLSRNFVVKYADDIRFDYENYRPIDSNPDKHVFFRVIDRNNDRMQHLALLTRLLILEENNGPADLKDTEVIDYIERYQTDDGVGNDAFAGKPQAQSTLNTMKAFYDVFKDDPTVEDDGGVKELRIEYFIISIYLLLRHLIAFYVWQDEEKRLFKDFVFAFHGRWKARREDDNDLLVFADHRQQTAADIEVRQRILRQVFFDFVADQNKTMLTKDDGRAFNEGERIQIYRNDEGLCQICLAEGKPAAEALVPWSEYEADHVVPHVRGGRTNPENAQVLCVYHNRSKGGTLPMNGCLPAAGFGDTGAADLTPGS
jgi:hypothetical protein